MRGASGPDLRRPVAPVGVVLPAVWLAVVALVTALAAGLAAGRSTPPRQAADGVASPVAELVTPTPGVLAGRGFGAPAPAEPATVPGPAPGPR